MSHDAAATVSQVYCTNVTRARHFSHHDVVDNCGASDRHGDSAASGWAGPGEAASAVRNEARPRVAAGGVLSQAPAQKPPEGSVMIPSPFCGFFDDRTLFFVAHGSKWLLEVAAVRRSRKVAC